MVNRATSHLRTAGFALLAGGLTASSVLLGILLHRVLEAAPTFVGQKQAYLLRLAWLVGIVLILTVAMLALVVIHYVAWRLSRAQAAEPFQPMGYEDVWTEAGRRLKPQDAPPVYPYERPDRRQDEEDRDEQDQPPDEQ